MSFNKKYTKNTQSGCTGTHRCPGRTYFGSMYTLYTQCTARLSIYFGIFSKAHLLMFLIEEYLLLKKNSRTIPSGVKWFWVPRMDPFWSKINPVQLD